MAALDRLGLRLTVFPYWPRMVLLFVLLAPTLLAIPTALFGPENHSGGLVGVVGGIGAAARSWQRDRPFWSISTADRRRVINVQRGGPATGDTTLDEIALDRRRRSQRVGRPDRIVIWVVYLAVVLVPLIAALRSTQWWLLALIPLVMALGQAVLIRRASTIASDPGQRPEASGN